MIATYIADLAAQNAKLHQDLSRSMSAHLSTVRVYGEHFTKLRTENENLLAQIDELDDELDDAYNTIAMYEEESDRELDELLDQAINELFPQELNDRG